MNSNGPLLHFQDFSILDRESGRDLCRPFSEALEPGSLLILSGPNGIGKSSTLRAIAEGPKTTVRSNGKIEVQTAQIFYHPQITSNLFAIPITLGDVLSWSENRDESLLKGLDLDRPWNSASGGEKQRILLSRLLGEAQDQNGLLLLDEPTNHLDSESRTTLTSALKGWIEKPGTRRAIVAVTHDTTVFTSFLKLGKVRELEEMK